MGYEQKLSSRKKYNKQLFITYSKACLKPPLKKKTKNWVLRPITA